MKQTDCDIEDAEFDTHIVWWKGVSYHMPTGFMPGFRAWPDGQIRYTTADDFHLGNKSDPEEPGLFRFFMAGPNYTGIANSRRQDYGIIVEVWSPGHDRRGAGISLDLEGATTLRDSLNFFINDQIAKAVENDSTVITISKLQSN